MIITRANADMRQLLTGILLAILMAGCATHVATSGRVVVRDDQAELAMRISDQDRKTMYAYYRDSANARKMPPGLAKRERLPPGLARRDILPAGLRGRELPNDLEPRLSPLPAIYVRLLIGHDVVLLHRNSRIVIDVAYGIVP